MVALIYNWIWYIIQVEHFYRGDQAKLEVDYKRELKEKFDIEFSSLFTINNLPISRFLDYLLKTEKYEEYMKVLVDNFNPTTVSSVMCKNTLSVGWDGKLFDCDFNQMLALGVEDMKPHISQVSSSDFENRKIVVSPALLWMYSGSWVKLSRGTVLNDH